MESICEAAFRLGEKAAELAPSQPWGDIRGMGNRLRHAYDRIDLDVLWNTIRERLPSLKPDPERAGGPAACHLPQLFALLPTSVRFYAPEESLIFGAGSSSLQSTSLAGRNGITSSSIAVVPAFSQTSVAKFCKRSHSQEPQILETEDAIFPILNTSE